MVEFGRVSQGHAIQAVGDGEHHVKVFHGQQVLLLFLEPVGTSAALALGAVAVAARVVQDDLPAATTARLQVRAGHTLGDPGCDTANSSRRLEVGSAVEKREPPLRPNAARNQRGAV